MDDSAAARLKTMDTSGLGRRIRARRLARSMTQAQLAGSDVTVAYVSRIEAGQRRPDARLCEAFADRLGTTAEFLIDGVEPSQARESDLRLRYAELALESGEALEAESIAQALLAAETVLLPEQDADAHYLHARAMESLGKLDDAILELQAVLDRPDRLGRRGAAGIALSRCLRECGDLIRSIEVGEATLAQLSLAGLDGSDEAIQLAVTVAFAYFLRGDVGHAVRLCKAAIAKAEKVDSTTGRASAYWNASIFASGQGDAVAAIPLAEKALALLGEGNDLRNLSRLRSLLGSLLLRLDPPRHREALAYLRRAKRDLKASSASPIDLVRCDLHTARALIAAGDLVSAQDLAQQAAQDSEELSSVEVAEAQAILGQLSAAEGDTKEARARYRRAVALLTGIGADREAAQLWLELGALLEGVGDTSGARDAYKRAAVSTGLRLPTHDRARVDR